MFPTNNPIDDLFFNDSSISCTPNTALEEYQFTSDVSFESSGLIINTMAERGKKLAAIPEENEEENTNEEKMKPIPKEIERKRRQEMTILHSSLRSLLPLEYIRGKRSVSDHIHESVNYIKAQEKNIKELSIKRDKLQKMSNSNVASTSTENSINNVTISPWFGGFEILITSVVGEDVFPLARVLQVVLEEGFNVTNYVSMQARGKLFVTIKLEADNSTSIDQSCLQQKLDDAIK